MAKLSVSVDVPLPPERAWAAASDLSRYKEWLSIHRVWRSKLPETLEKGTELVSIVEVKGMPNRIEWTIVNYKPPESMTLDGAGKGGVKVKLIERSGRPRATRRPRRSGSTSTSAGPRFSGPSEWWSRARSRATSSGRSTSSSPSSRDGFSREQTQNPLILPG